MKKIFFFKIAIACFLLSACTTFPKDDIKVNAEADPKVNFSAYKAYTWLGSVGILNDPERKWKPLKFDIDSEITFLINRELRDRNILESNNNAGLFVTYGLGVNMAALKEKIDPERKISTLENVPQGALLVLLVDAQSGFIIWAASATAEVKNLAPEQAKKRLEYTITQMFKKLPK